jgi:hypothetical protein
MMNWWRRGRIHRLCLPIAAYAIGGGCASGGVHTGRLVTVVLPPGFAGTWIRSVADSRIGASDGPVLDTLRLTDTTTYRSEHAVHDRSDAALQALLALPGGSELTGKIDVEGYPSQDALVKRNHVTVNGDTVIVVNETTRIHQGVIARATTREYLSPDHARLIAETSIQYPAYAPPPVIEKATGEESLRAARAGPSSRLVVFDRAQ